MASHRGLDKMLMAIERGPPCAEKGTSFIAPIGPSDRIEQNRTCDADTPTTARDIAARVRPASPRMSAMHQLGPLIRKSN